MAIDEKIGIYLKSSGTGLVSQVVTKLSGFAAVWLLNRILMKGAYGDYEFALALVSMLLILGSGGLQYVAMYRTSRLDAEPETLAGQKLAGALLGWSLLLSVAVALAVGALAPVVASASGKPELSFWIGALAFLIPIRVALGLYRNWYRARQLVAQSLVFGQMGPAVFRVLFLGGAWLAWTTPEGIVAAVLLGEGLPLLVWFIRSPLNPFHLGGILSGWDVQYAVKLMFTRGLSKSVKRTDVIMMGAFATSGATAGYVVASKVAMVLLVGHKLINQILTPRIGRFLSQEDWTSVREEYHQSRVLALIVALVGGAFLSMFGGEVLGWFGEYSAAHSILLILAATYIVHVSFGMCGGYLNIAGYGGWTLITTALVLLTNVVLNYLLIPVIGGEGAAVAMFVSFVLTNLLTVYLVKRLDDVQTYSLWLGGITGIAASALGAAAYGVIPPWGTSLVLLIIVGKLIVNEITFLRALAHSVVGAVPFRI